MKTQKLTLLAMLAALATVGRILFSSLFYLPNVQPVSTLVIICGIWLGPVEGVILAVLSTILSNLVLGMGIWTLPQILCWGIIGLISGLIGKYRKSMPIWVLALFSAFVGYGYGLVMSLTYGTIGNHFWAYYLSGLMYDTYHAVGNVIFMVTLYPVLSKLFVRFLEKDQNLRSYKSLKEVNHF